MVEDGLHLTKDTMILMFELKGEMHITISTTKPIEQHIFCK